MRTKQTRFFQRLRDQSAFTLIELLATMGILSVLAGMISPAVTGTKEASVDAETLASATQVRSSAMDYFKDQVAAETRTPHTVTPTAYFGSAATGTQAQQFISSRWPELFITHDARLESEAPPADALYAAVFPTDESIVSSVTLRGKDGVPVDGSTLLTKYTAIDLAELVSGGYLAKVPNSADNVSGTGIYNFLWLFKKFDSSRHSTGDDREVVVFKLTKVEQLESVRTNDQSKQNIALTYQQVF